MEKLSELSDDTVLTVQISNGVIDVMSKKDFLNSYEYLNREKEDKKYYPKVTVGVPKIVKFDFNNAFEDLEDEMHEDWREDVIDTLTQQGFDFEGIERMINNAFAKHPTYYEGVIVDIET